MLKLVLVRLAHVEVCTESRYPVFCSVSVLHRAFVDGLELRACLVRLSILGEYLRDRDDSEQDLIDGSGVSYRLAALIMAVFARIALAFPALSLRTLLACTGVRCAVQMHSSVCLSKYSASSLCFFGMQQRCWY